MLLCLNIIVSRNRTLLSPGGGGQGMGAKVRTESGEGGVVRRLQSQDREPAPSLSMRLVVAPPRGKGSQGTRVKSGHTDTACRPQDGLLHVE